MNKETWRTLPEWEGQYFINEDGEILSKERKAWNYVKKERILKPYMINTGYRAIDLSLTTGKIKMLIHRMVAMCFVDNPLNLPDVNHINGNKLDNRPCNLEWCTHKNNMIHAAKNNLLNVARGSKSGVAVLDEEKVSRIKGMLNGSNPMYKIAELFNVSTGTVQAIKEGRTWRHVAI